MLLCCLGCAIFGISEVPDENGVEYDTGNFVDLDNLNNATVTVSPHSMNYNESLQQPSVATEQPTREESMAAGSKDDENDMGIRELD